MTKWIWVILLLFPFTLQANQDFVLGGDDGALVSRQDAIQQMITNIRNALPQYMPSLFGGSGDPTIGNPSGSITLVEFIDYQCPYCLKMATVVDALVQNNPELRVVIKALPLHGAMSELAAKIAIVANKQGKFLAFHQAAVKLSLPLTQAALFNAAKAARLDMTQLKADINSAATLSILNNEVALAQGLGLRGTPAFFINRTQGASAKAVKMFFGMQSKTTLQNEINSLRVGNDQTQI